MCFKGQGLKNKQAVIDAKQANNHSTSESQKAQSWTSSEAREGSFLCPAGKPAVPAAVRVPNKQRCYITITPTHGWRNRGNIKG